MIQRSWPFQGVTFMAFGNGAADIFAAMASVLGSGQPKVGLAVGGLVGMINLDCRGMR